MGVTVGVCVRRFLRRAEERGVRTGDEVALGACAEWRSGIALNTRTDREVPTYRCESYPAGGDGYQQAPVASREVLGRPAVGQRPADPARRPAHPGRRRRQHGRAGAGDDGGYAVGAAARGPAPATRAWRARGTPGAGRSRVAASRSSGCPASAATSRAARPELAAASACGTGPGSRPRASVRRHRGRRHEDHGARPGVDPGRHREERPSPLVPGDDEPAVERRRDVVGVALDLARPAGTGVVVHEQRAARRPAPAARQTPATIAADDEPRPRPCGIALRRSSAGRAAGCPSPRRRRRIARTTRCDSSRGTSPAPSPVTSTSRPPRRSPRR